MLALYDAPLLARPSNATARNGTNSSGDDGGDGAARRSLLATAAPSGAPTIVTFAPTAAHPTSGPTSPTTPPSVAPTGEFPTLSPSSAAPSYSREPTVPGVPAWEAYGPGGGHGSYYDPRWWAIDHGWSDGYHDTAGFENNATYDVRSAFGRPVELPTSANAKVDRY